MADRLLDIADPQERRRAVALVAELEQLGETACSDCGHAVCGHQYVMNAAMGFKDTPRCVACLAGALEQPVGDFLDRVGDYVDRRACFRAAWGWADEAEGTEGERRPRCVGDLEASEATSPVLSTPAGAGAISPPAAVWDAGEMSCGDLVLELRLRLMKLEPGDVLEVTATDPAAPEDIPAWCGLTRHRLLRAEPPSYWIERKEA